MMWKILLKWWEKCLFAVWEVLEVENRREIWYSKHNVYRIAEKGSEFAF